MRGCGPYRTSEPPAGCARSSRLDSQLVLEGLVVVCGGLVVLVSGVLSEHAVGPIATLGAVITAAACWDVWRHSSKARAR